MLIDYIKNLDREKTKKLVSNILNHVFIIGCEHTIYCLPKSSCECFSSILDKIVNYILSLKHSNQDTWFDTLYECNAKNTDSKSCALCRKNFEWIYRNVIDQQSSQFVIDHTFGPIIAAILRKCPEVMSIATTNKDLSFTKTMECSTYFPISSVYTRGDKKFLLANLAKAGKENKDQIENLVRYIFPNDKMYGMVCSHGKIVSTCKKCKDYFMKETFIGVNDCIFGANTFIENRMTPEMLIKSLQFSYGCSMKCEYKSLCTQILLSAASNLASLTEVVMELVAINGQFSFQSYAKERILPCLIKSAAQKKPIIVSTSGEKSNSKRNAYTYVELDRKAVMYSGDMTG